MVSALALVGSVTTVLHSEVFERIIEYSDRSYEKWRAADWLLTCRLPRNANICVVCIFFAPPHAITRPACIASTGAHIFRGSAATMTMSPVLPGCERFPDTAGRNIAETQGEIGLAVHWLTRMLHTAFSDVSSSSHLASFCLRAGTIDGGCTFRK